LRYSLTLWAVLLALISSCSWGASPAEAIRGAERYVSGKGGNPDDAIAGLRGAGIRDPQLERDIRGGESSFHNARARLRTLEELSGAPPASGNVAAKVKGILADPVFRRSNVRAEETLGYRVWQWITERLNELGKFFDRLFGNAGGSVGGVGTVLYWGAIAVLGALVVVAAFLLAARIRLKRREKEDADSAAAVDEYVAASAGEWLRRAEQYSAEGQWRLAVRCLYMATLVRLDEAGLIHYSAGLTNWEYVRRVRRGGGERFMPVLEPMTDRFDRVWYGGVDPNEPDFRAAKDGYGAVSVLCGSGAIA
jgi:hypothetical protein